MRISQACMMSGLIYSCHSWTLSQLTLNRLQHHYFESLRRCICAVRARDRGHGFHARTAVYRLAYARLHKYNGEDAATRVLRLHWRWMGHAARLGFDHLTHPLL